MLFWSTRHGFSWGERAGEGAACLREEKRDVDWHSCPRRGERLEEEHGCAEVFLVFACLITSSAIGWNIIDQVLKIDLAFYF